MVWQTGAQINLQQTCEITHYKFHNFIQMSDHFFISSSLILEGPPTGVVGCRAEVVVAVAGCGLRTVMIGALVQLPQQPDSYLGASLVVLYLSQSRPEGVSSHIGHGC